MHATPLLLGFIIMSVGSLAIYAHGAKHHAVRLHTQLHALVPFIAATCYLGMYLGTLVVERADGVTIYIPRYIDWTFTTPILLANLALVALHERRSGGFITALVGLDVVMILTGLASAMSVDSTARLVWFLWSCAAFAGVLFLIWGPMAERSRALGGAIDSAFRGNAMYLTVVWLLYPVVVGLGPTALGVISPAASIWLILILDVIAKVVYGFVSGERVKRAESHMSTLYSRID